MPKPLGLATPAAFWSKGVRFWRDMVAMRPGEELYQRHLEFNIEQLRLAQEKEGSRD